MKKLMRDLTLSAGKMSPRQIRLVLLLVTLILFVIGAGAPEGEGGWGGI